MLIKFHGILRSTLETVSITFLKKSNVLLNHVDEKSFNQIDILMFENSWYSIKILKFNLKGI